MLTCYSIVEKLAYENVDHLKKNLWTVYKITTQLNNAIKIN